MILPTFTRIKKLPSSSAMIYACRNALRGLAFLPKQSHQSSAISEAVSILKSPTQYPLQELTAAYENLGETLAVSATATEYDVYSEVDCALLAILAYETASLDKRKSLPTTDQWHI